MNFKTKAKNSNKKKHCSKVMKPIFGKRIFFLKPSFIKVILKPSYSCLQSELILTIANYHKRRRKMVNEIMTRSFHISFSEAYYFSLCCEVYQEKRDLQGTQIHRHTFTRVYLKNYAPAAILRNVNTLILV